MSIVRSATFYKFRTDGDDLDVRFDDIESSNYGVAVCVTWSGSTWRDRDIFQEPHIEDDITHKEWMEIEHRRKDMLDRFRQYAESSTK